MPAGTCLELLKVGLDLAGDGVGDGAPHLRHLLPVALPQQRLAITAAPLRVGQLHHAHHAICSRPSCMAWPPQTTSGGTRSAPVPHAKEIEKEKEIRK
jgi:hypothetical protein